MPVSLKPVLRIVAVYVMCPLSGHPAPGGGFSIYQTAHAMWLRTLSIALQKELKVLEYVYRLSLFSLVKLFSFVSAFSCFSD